MKKISLILILLIIFTPIKHGHAMDQGKYLDVKLSRTLAYGDYLDLASEGGLSLYKEDDKYYPLINLYETRLRARVDQGGNIDLLDSGGRSIYSFNVEEGLLIGSASSYNPIIKIGDSDYRGYIKFLPKANNVYLINHLDLEDYLYGVVPKEVPYSWPEETLKAQAIASRSFAISNINKHIKDGYNLCDTTDCQVYGGVVSERDTTSAAIDATRGIFVFYNDRVAEAIFHSTSSGYTEDSKNVWGGDIPYLKSVKDIYSLNSPYSSWTTTIKISDIENNLKSNGINIGQILNIEIIDTLHTNRVNSVRLSGTLGEEIVSGNKFRSLLGNTVLKSSYFTLGQGGGMPSSLYVLAANMEEAKEVSIDSLSVLSADTKSRVSRSSVSRSLRTRSNNNPDNYYSISQGELILSGSGYGHGVGMSQYGALEMGKLGFTYEEILKFYYTDVEIRREY